METVSLRKHCKLCFKIHYVKEFFVTFFLFFFRERKRKETNQRKQKERPWEVWYGTPKNARKTRLAFLRNMGTCRAYISTKMLAHASHFQDVSCRKNFVRTYFGKGYFRKMQMYTMTANTFSNKPSRPKRAAGGQASACRQTKGIFCESRIFGVIPGYVRTNITVSSGGLT